MNLNIFKKISPAFKKQLVGGIIGSLTYWGDRAIADTQTWYPAELKGKLAPQLPRNDELITSIVPPVIMYVVAKKKPAKFRDLAKGTIMYSGPHLMNRIVVSALGAPTASAPFRVVSAYVNQNVNNKIYPRPMAVQAVAASAPMGKYR